MRCAQPAAAQPYERLFASASELAAQSSSGCQSCQTAHTCLQVADASKQVKRVLYLLQPVQCVCFLNAKGDILAGLGNRVVVTPADAYQYLSPQQMQQLLAQHAAQAAIAGAGHRSWQASEVRGVPLIRGVPADWPCQHGGSGVSWQPRQASPSGRLPSICELQRSCIGVAATSSSISCHKKSNDSCRHAYPLRGLAPEEGGVLQDGIALLLKVPSMGIPPVMYRLSKHTCTAWLHPPVQKL